MGSVVIVLSLLGMIGGLGFLANPKPVPLNDRKKGFSIFAGSVILFIIGLMLR